MGHSFGVICQTCQHRFTISHGPGFYFNLLRCESCGKTKNVTLEEMEKVGISRLDKAGVENIAGKCECGGNFTEKAQPRCPECGSVEHKVAEDGEFMQWI